jgi:site-specific recombinase XerD
MKNGQLAIVPLFPETEQLLKKLKNNVNPGPYKIYLRRIKKLFIHFGIPLEEKQGTHIGRHIFGSEMLEMGFSMESVSRMMGHSTTKETEKVYAKINYDKIKSDYDRIKQVNQVTQQLAV